MSVIGPGNLGAINLAGSLAGAQQNQAAEAGQARQTASQRAGAADLKEMTSKALDGVDAADQSAERDADGRMPYAGTGDDQTAEQADTVRPQQPGSARGPRAKDATGDRGRTLDLEA